MKISINTSNLFPETKHNHLKMGTDIANGANKKIRVNSRFIEIDGKPVLPVMGEFHFSRYPCKSWETELLKMKACGINIISTYFFWIHHEEDEGIFNFGGDRDLKTFIEFCSKLGLYVIVRIGPWCHGEVRNGGFPDWIIQKCKNKRTNDEQYLFYVKRLFKEYAAQITNLLYKNNGPIIGIQLENELYNNAAHLLALKNTILEYGLEVPIYTATGWGEGGNLGAIPEYEMIPMFGGYPEAPWHYDTDPLSRNVNYLFTPGRCEGLVGNEQIISGSASKKEDELNDYPYAVCEAGPGVQVTYRRRPVIAPRDTYALAISMLARGANLLGYYVFHGGRNPDGIGGIYQESKDSGDYCDLPVKSYDFQAPVSEYGFMRDSYSYYRLLHLFINECTDTLPLTIPYYHNINRSDVNDKETPRIIARLDESGSGYVFINTYDRTQMLKPLENLNIEINSTMLFSFDFPAENTAIFPLNQSFNGLKINFTTTQFITAADDGTNLFFTAIDGVNPVFEIENTENIILKNAVINKNFITAIPSRDITFTYKNINVYVLSFTDALHLNKINGKIYLSNDMLTDNAGVELFSAFTDDVYLHEFKDNCFNKINLHVKNYKPEIRLTESERRIIYHNKYTRYLFYNNLNWCPEYELDIPSDVFNNCDDVKLTLYGQFDVMQIYNGSELVADWFNTGDTFEIGLARFRDIIENNEKLRIKISQLEVNTDVYIERKIERGKAELKLLDITPYYYIKIV